MNTQPTSLTCKTEENYCRHGAETLLRLLSGVEDLIDGVLENKDIEYVHKTRVASRRLRAALPLFVCCYSKKEYKNWMEEIKKVTRLLAAARDLDVQIAFIEQYTKKLELTQEKEALTALLKSHRASRRAAQAAVAAGLGELRVAGTLSQIELECRQTLKAKATQPFLASEVLERAHWHIAFRLDDFLSMEKYVTQEKRRLQHHQMRIYAKKLRYTMECFAPLYSDKLESEIATIKEFQDVLGEMHDCDVWLDYIPMFRKKMRRNQTTKNLSTLGLRNFAVYVAGRRRKFYSQFISLWNETKRNDFFGHLRKRTGTEVQAQTLNSTLNALKDKNVKVAVISDVHGNLQALQKVLKDAKQHGASVFLNAGDSVGFGADPDEAVQLLSEENVVGVAGNFDLEVLAGNLDVKGEKRLAYRYAQKALSKAAISYLEGLPSELRLEVAGRKLLLTHGAPGDVNKQILPDAPNDELKAVADAAKADLIVVGHSHTQFWRQIGGVDYVNSGSVGRPGDGNPQAAYAMLSFNPFKAELYRVNYDVEEAADALREARMPESYAQMLLSGVSLDYILKEDHVRWVNSLKTEEETFRVCMEYAVACWPDKDHTVQVTSLALALFDALSKLHGLSLRERFWLRCAATLHDVGLSKQGGAHHKKSAQLVLNATVLPFSSRERRIIAAVARYHRKALPKPRHTLLGGLDHASVEKICALAAILRLADSLDCTHQSSVKVLGVNVEARKVVVECISAGELTLEQDAFQKKKDLFEKVFNKKVTLEWSRQTKPLNE